MLHERLTEPLCSSAVDLPGQQQWIERRAKIIHHNVIKDARFSGCWVDLDFGNVSAIWVGRLRRRERISRRQSCHAIWTLRKRGEGDFTIGPGNANRAVRNLKIIRTRFERFAG